MAANRSTTSATTAADIPPGADLERYRGYLCALAQIELGRRLRSKVDPSDIVQQSLLEAHQDLATRKGRTEAELVAWLRTILARNLLNTARDFAAQKRDLTRERSMTQQLANSSVRLERFLASEQTTPSQIVIRSEDAEKLATALAELPDDQRRAVILKHFHNCTLAEIAKDLDRSTLAVAGLLKRGLKKLRMLMSEAEVPKSARGA